MAATAAISAAIIGAGATLYTSAESKKAMKANRPKALPGLPEVDMSALDRQRRKRLGGTGRSDTISTSPLGLTSEAGGQRATLLGM